MSSPDNCTVIVLAAGKGTRMKSSRAKVLHELFFKPMVCHVLDSIKPLKPTQTIVVVGHQQEHVKKAVSDYSADFALQEQQLGTGHAVLCTEEIISIESSTILILCGDTPLIRPETLKNLIHQHRHSQATVTLMTTILDDPCNYGRIVSDDSETVLAIVEQKDCNIQQAAIQEINAGIYCVDRNFLFSTLKNVGTNNSQGEVYLTDIVGLAVQMGLKVEKYSTKSSKEVLGVNSRVELAEAQIELQQRFNRTLMLQGVSMYNPETILISPEVKIGEDVTIEPLVKLTGSTQIDNGAIIGQGAILHDCAIHKGERVAPYSVRTGNSPLR